MSKVEENQNKEAIGFIAAFQKKAIETAEFTVKNGSAWDYEHESLEFTENTKSLMATLLTVAYEHESISTDFKQICMDAIISRIDSGKDIWQVKQLLKTFELLSTVINACKSYQVEILSHKHQYDDLSMQIKKYIKWADKQDVALVNSN